MFILAIYIMVGCSNKVQFGSQIAQDSSVLTEPEAGKLEINLAKQGLPVEDINCVNDDQDTQKLCNVICHVPPGNPANAHTIVIGYPAVNAHLSHHDDYVGSCKPLPPADPCTCDLPPRHEQGSSNEL